MLKRRRRSAGRGRRRTWRAAEADSLRLEPLSGRRLPGRHPANAPASRLETGMSSSRPRVLVRLSALVQLQQVAPDWNWVEKQRHLLRCSGTLAVNLTGDDARAAVLPVSGFWLLHPDAIGGSWRPKRLRARGHDACSSSIFLRARTLSPRRVTSTASR